MNAAGPPTLDISDSALLRRVFATFATGVTVLTVGGEVPHGMTANSFTSVSLDPPLVLVCIGRDAIMHRSLSSARSFAVSVLGSQQEAVARHFANRRRELGKAQFDQVDWRPGPRTGAPLIKDALAHFECAVWRAYDGGDHTIFVGKLLAMRQQQGDDALLFFSGRFRQLHPGLEQGDRMNDSQRVQARPGRVPPGPPLRATPALFARLARDRLSLMMSAVEQYGDAVRVRVGPKTMYIFNDPGHAKHVLADNSANYGKGIGLIQARRALGDGLLTSEGELWRKQRRTIQPVFQHKRIAWQAEAVAEEGAKFVARLRAQAGCGPVNLPHEVTQLTLGVLGRTLLDADLGVFDSIGSSFEAVQDQAMFEMVTLGMVPMWVPLPAQMRFRRARQELQHVVERLVAQAAARPGDDADDVVSRLIVSTRQEPDPRVAQQRMRDELVTLLLAGHETTASTLSWTLYLIDRHPEVRARLRAEAADVLGDRLPGYSDLPELRYTTMVVEEAIRLYPPVWILTRQARQDDEVGGYRVPAGSDVLICPYTLHRHPAFWPEPERFDPGRFGPEQSARRPRYSYIPFGAGPRFCVGNNLGMMEAVFVIAMLARELTLTTVPGYRVVPEPMLSLRVRGGLPMTVGLAA